MNRKRMQRMWREEGLRVPDRAKKRRRWATRPCPPSRLRAERPDEVWALDFQLDASTDGHELKLLSVTDEFTREALAIEVERWITADDTVAVLEHLAAERGVAANIRADNGPELTAASAARLVSVRARLTPPTSSRAALAEPLLESSNASVRDELLDVEAFATLLEAQVLADDWRIDYNANDPTRRSG